MGVPANIFSIISDFDLLVRFALIILMALYGLFALIVAVQIANLNRVLHQVGSSVILSMVSIIHALAAIALLLLSVVFL